MKKLNPLYIKIGIGLLIIISLLFNFKQCNDNKITSSNIITLTDTLKTTKNKIGEEVKSKQILLMDITQLKTTNSGLTNDINNLSAKDKKNLIDIAKLNITINLLKDSVLILTSGDEVVIDDTTKMFPYTFAKTDKFRDVQGIIKVTTDKKPQSVVGLITTDKVFADIVIGKKETTNGIEIFATSSNPAVSITNIQGSIIDLTAYNKYQKVKPFGIGLQVGYGIGGNGFTPYIGVGISYNIIKL